MLLLLLNMRLRCDWIRGSRCRFWMVVFLEEGEFECFVEYYQFNSVHWFVLKFHGKATENPFLISSARCTAL